MHREKSDESFSLFNCNVKHGEDNICELLIVTILKKQTTTIHSGLEKEMSLLNCECETCWFLNGIHAN